MSTIPPCGLKIVILSSNKLTSIPELTASAAVLTEVTAGENLLTQIPDWLTGDGAPAFLHLATLQFPSNAIPDVPPGIHKLSGLKVLDLVGNQLKSVPGELADTPRIKELRLGQNPITDRRFAKLIADSRTKISALLDYIRKTCPKVLPLRPPSDFFRPLTHSKDSRNSRGMGCLSRALQVARRAGREKGRGRRGRRW